ncbi:hypothetical protein CC86DRAFT_328374 [Ophiobolus disseminans]|uniref:Integral membrane protein-like protein n=1 Tax=Ophiobolus disseminans TaxID=1469910 RepID=A0A6A6ZQ91_9PLEO|nr:hypothetical protein CC86DRAFT_328374 [Ophiobolus disseminans]
MGKAGRFACILTPMLLTLAGLICIILVMIGQLSTSGNNAPTTKLGRDLYFFKADTSNFGDKPNKLDDLNIDNNLLEALQGQASAGHLKDFYQVGLWSYCEGDKDPKTGVETITHCSSSKSNFWFDPFTVWNLKNSTAQKIVGDEKLEKGLNTYKKVSGFMIWSFGIALALSAAEIIIGFFAIFSRWGSLVTTIISTAQTIFILAAASTATATYGLLVGVFETALKDINIEANMGKQMLGVMWLAVAFGVASGLFWLFSVCCCSGKSPHKKVSVEKTPYTYERVASPAFPAQHGQQHTGYAGASHSQQQGTAYEPFRKNHV